MKISQKLVATVRLSQLRQYKIATRANLTSSALSRLLCGIDKIKDNDPRIIRVGQVLGIPPQDCFDAESVDNQTKSNV